MSRSGVIFIYLVNSPLAKWSVNSDFVLLTIGLEAKDIYKLMQIKLFFRVFDGNISFRPRIWLVSATAS